MEDSLKELTKKEMQSQAAQAIEESFDGVWAAMEESKAEHDDEEHEHKFKYKLGVGITIEPLGDECKVSAKANWTEKHEVAIEPVMVNANPDLFQVAEQKEVNETFAAQAETAAEIIRETGRATVSALTRKMKIKEDLALEIMVELEALEIVTAADDDGVRQVVVDADEE